MTEQLIHPDDREDNQGTEAEYSEDTMTCDRGNKRGTLTNYGATVETSR